ncbi:uncharacterized protein LAJ45_00942 [Morchella importuna]|uniref:uncharacterized protein n=1 Tax=Morchella importuna TaxID=1174673 RepID=UPI001E8DCE2E|nr:uncharacterized protein LAJ45_00942 [Morchella importuna]KAH8154415.1 hypothetical protein LAJ45_00942 [Morchella importuna]
MSMARDQTASTSPKGTRRPTTNPKTAGGEAGAEPGRAETTNPGTEAKTGVEKRAGATKKGQETASQTPKRQGERSHETKAPRKTDGHPVTAPQAGRARPRHTAGAEERTHHGGKNTPYSSPEEHSTPNTHAPAENKKPRPGGREETNRGTARDGRHQGREGRRQNDHQTGRQAPQVAGAKPDRPPGAKGRRTPGKHTTNQPENRGKAGRERWEGGRKRRVPEQVTPLATNPQKEQEQEQVGDQGSREDGQPPRQSRAGQGRDEGRKTPAERPPPKTRNPEDEGPQAEKRVRRTERHRDGTSSETRPADGQDGTQRGQAPQQKEDPEVAGQDQACMPKRHGTQAHGDQNDEGHRKAPQKEAKNRTKAPETTNGHPSTHNTKPSRRLPICPRSSPAGSQGLSAADLPPSSTRCPRSPLGAGFPSVVGPT